MQMGERKQSKDGMKYERRRAHEKGNVFPRVRDLMKQFIIISECQFLRKGIT